MTDQEIGVGRIVHIMNTDLISCTAAIVTFVHPDTTIDVTIFPRGKANPYPLVTVPTHDWHWPERV